MTRIRGVAATRLHGEVWKQSFQLMEGFGSCFFVKTVWLCTLRMRFAHTQTLAEKGSLRV